MASRRRSRSSVFAALEIENDTLGKVSALDILGRLSPLPASFSSLPPERPSARGFGMLVNLVLDLGCLSDVVASGRLGRRPAVVSLRANQSNRGFFSLSLSLSRSRSRSRSLVSLAGSVSEGRGADGGAAGGGGLG